jgi:hypothetical protein
MVGLGRTKTQIVQQHRKFINAEGAGGVKTRTWSLVYCAVYIHSA